MKDWAEIRRLHRAEGVSISEIARRVQRAVPALADQRGEPGIAQVDDRVADLDAARLTGEPVLTDEPFLATKGRLGL